jgi:hypothetical protein
MLKDDMRISDLVFILFEALSTWEDDKKKADLYTYVHIAPSRACVRIESETKILHLPNGALAM